MEQPLPYDNDCDYLKILTPYSTMQFQHFFKHSQLLPHYSELPFKLMHGFLIGYLKPLKQTFTPPNLPRANLNADVIHARIDEELCLGHYSGPFTQEELEKKIEPFCSSLLQINIKEGAPGEPVKYQVCQHLSYKGKSQSFINDEINSDDFPMCWRKAADVAEIICLSTLSLTLNGVSTLLFSCLQHPCCFAISS